MDLYDIAIAKKLSSSGGGGGSSDFSTAEVITTGGENVSFTAPPIMIFNDQLVAGPLRATSELVLYKNSQMFIFTEHSLHIISAEGTGGVSVEYDETYQEYSVTVTGNGTLTIETEAA